MQYDKNIIIINIFLDLLILLLLPYDKHSKGY